MATAPPIACTGCGIGLGETDPREARRTARRWWGIGIGAVLAANSMMFGLAINTSEAGPTTRLILHSVLLGAAVLTFLILGGPLLAESFRALRRGQLTIEGLFLTGLLGAGGASLVAMITGEGPVYFETVIILLVVYSLGNQLTRISQRRALRSIESWQGAPPTCERIDPDGTIKEVVVESIGPGDQVRIHPGRMIPIDGVISSGECFVQQAQITGEFFAVPRHPGQSVFAGSYCVDGTLIVRATAPGNRRRIDLLAKAVEQAQAHPSRYQTEADRLVRWFLPIVVGIALVTFAGWTWGVGWREGLFNALAVLLIACPCALGFATPVSVWSTVGRLAHLGLVCRRGDIVENLAAVDTVIFDKTGTLTESKATLVDLVFAENLEVDHQTLRTMIAAVQRASDHPIAAAFHDLVAEQSLANVEVEEIELIPGKGLRGQCRVQAGSWALTIGSEAVIGENRKSSWAELKKQIAAPAGSRRIAVILDGRLAAAAAVDERILETGPAVIQTLKAMDLQLELMTGDRPDRARRMGIDSVHADLQPEDKQRLVDERKRAGRHVLFIGDGLNDAIAMAHANVSIAPATAAPLASETAQAILMNPDLTLVAYALKLSGRARRVINTNLKLAVSYNAAGMAIACAGLLHPVAAVLIMACSSLVVTWRSLRLLEDEEFDALMGERSEKTIALVSPLPTTTVAGRS